MTEEQNLVVDEEAIRKSIRSNVPITITTYTLPRETEVYIANVLAVFLRFAGHENLRDYIEYCVQELSSNAKKANTKRVYFAERKLDINNPDQYRYGMSNFKKDMLENMPHYLRLQKDSGLYVKVNILYCNDAIQIEVRNNVTLSKTETIRIHDKLARARKFNSLEDAFSQVLDDSEGAGLGLVVLVLMLKKMGLYDENFDISATKTETVARLEVPLEQALLATVSGITEIIATRVKALPHFPENIIKVQEMLSDPKSEITDIAKKISVDPAMTADIIKLVNSASYMSKKKTDTISEAVKILGISGIKKLLYSYGSQKLLGNDTEEKKALWKHSHRTAYYAFNLAKNFCHDKNSVEDVYLGGMLHDMGKIVLSAVMADSDDRMELFRESKNISAFMFEDVRAGINHAEVGALVAEKWNFPENLVASIRYHHSPGRAPEIYRTLVDAVYLANMLCEVENGGAIFEQIDGSVLERFNIVHPDQIKKVIKAFSRGFDEETS
jgi:putative nucleotidyltransferase with HDIG domain